MPPLRGFHSLILCKRLMLFNSFSFALFFIVVTVLYWLLRHRWRWLWLLVSSCYFYMYLYPQYILILFLLILIDYGAGILIENSENTVEERNPETIGKGRYQRKLYLILSLIANIGLLFYFKYTNFIAQNLNTLGFDFTLKHIILPIGLSFHTFQSMSYTIEVYRKQQRAERHLGKYALYVLFYPQLVAGPIERPQHILPQIERKKVFNYAQFTEGVKLMAWGLFKKVVIADRLSLTVDAVFKDYLNVSWAELWLATLFFTFQIYCDFSGYTDIARGAAKTMGFDLMENFNKPYSSSSISEFWRRWHISLSSWFRDYVYIPLGGNKQGFSRRNLNVLIVFTLSGLWHGAAWTFVLWGFLHGVGIVFENFKLKLFKIPPSVKRLFVFFFIALCWVIFRAETLNKAFYILKSLFVGTYNNVSFLNISVPLKNVLLGFMGIILLEIIQFFQKNRTIVEFINTQKNGVRWTIYYMIVLMILFLGVYENRQFIYFQF